MTSSPRIAILGLAHAAPPRHSVNTRQTDERSLAMGLPVDAQGGSAAVRCDDRRDHHLAPLAVAAGRRGLLAIAAVADERHEERADHRGAEHAAHHEADPVLVVVLAGVLERRRL